MTTDVAIIGGGLSGLAAAVELASRGVQVTLFEQSPKLGGRCYSYIDETTGDVVDNGQHVLLGAYNYTLRYLELVGTKHYLKPQSRLCLPLFHPVKGFAELKLSSLPKPFHVTAGILQFKLLSLRERQRLLNVGVVLHRWNAELESELATLTVDQWLTQLHQSKEAKKCFWNPIAISIMNEMPDRASALLFARSLKAAFLGKTSDASILIPSIGQTELYVTGAEQLLHRRKAEIFVNTEVETVEMLHSKVTGLKLKNGSRCSARYVICAVPYFALRKIIPSNMRHLNPFSNGETFDSSPIVSIHLWFDKEFMENEFVGLIGMRLQWIFNRRKIMNEGNKRSGYLSAVISGAHDFVDLPKEKLVLLALEDLKEVFPDCARATLLHSTVIKEKRATFSPTNEIEPLRPSTETPIQNFLLAGDWTDTGLPATIESAVMSGCKAARVILG